MNVAPRPAWQPVRWRVRGSIYVGPRYTYYPRPYYVYYPTYVPSYYATTSYYPVDAGPSQTPVYVAPARAPLPKLGIGLFAGGSAVESQDGGSHESDDLGLMARFRLTPGLIIEGEMGKMSYDVDGTDNIRVDRRLGASLLYEIGAYNKWAPYLLVGTGVQQADVGGGSFQTTQSYGEVGVGLRWAATPKFHITFDLRAGSRETVSSSSGDGMTTPPPVMAEPGVSPRTITPPAPDSDDSEEYTRGRLSAILYF